MEIVLICITLAAVFSGAFFYWHNKVDEKKRIGNEQELRKRVYELAILKEISDRAGYSLDIHKVIDIIIGSLHQFIEYSVVSYMLFDQDRLLFKADLERPVSKEFISDIKQRMIRSLGALLNRTLDEDKMEETITGSIMVDSATTPVRSYFNIPLVIGDKIVGILTVAHTRDGLYKEDEMTLLYKIVNQASQEVGRLQEVVRTEEKKLNAMVESMSEGIIMTDKEYRITVVNPAARKALGLLNTDPSIFDLIECLGEHFDMRGKLEESIKLDKLITTSDVVIKDRTFQIFVSPVKSDRGDGSKEVFGGVIILHDITHDKELDRMRDDFTSMMVHELRSPLDGIKKMGEMMKTDDGIRQDHATFTQYMDLMHESAGDMLELVNDLLDVAKIEAGKFEIRPDMVNIKEIIANRVAFFASSAQEAKLTLSSMITPDVPERVRFDGKRITQVLTNLIANAIKFTSENGTVRIDVLLHKQGNEIDAEAQKAGITWQIKDTDKQFAPYPDALFVGVTDTGIGIKKEDIGFLFNKFKQLEAGARSKEKKGTGLGLVIAKGIVEAHGGILGVASEVGAGSTFYFTIKL
jgi:PAS domain S-box-containing protein